MATRQTAHRSLHALRQTIEKIEGSANRFSSAATTAGSEKSRPRASGAGDDHAPLGIAELDEAMGGGFPLLGLGEMRCLQARDWGAACGFALMVLARLRQTQARLHGPLVWIADPAARREGGDIWVPGWRGIAPVNRGPDVSPSGHRAPGGIDEPGITEPGTAQGGAAPELLIVRPRTTREALWAAETAAAAPGIGAVIVEIRGNPGSLGLTQTRRLHFRARENRCPLLILRQSGLAEATAAPLRFLVGPAPAGLRLLDRDTPLPGSLGAPAMSVTLEKSRLPSPLTLILEWSAHECRFVARPGKPGTSRPSATADHGPLFPDTGDRQDHPQTPGTWLALERAG